MRPSDATPLGDAAGGGRRAAGPPGAYWGWDGDAAILLALRRFRAADEEMRRRLAGQMDTGPRDLSALELVINAELADQAVTPREIADHLGISTASTTKLLDRLVANGHVARVPNPGDRRSVVIRATAGAHAEMRARLAEMHARMAQIAGCVPEHCRPALVAFLDAMAAEMESGPGDRRAGGPA